MPSLWKFGGLTPLKLTQLGIKKIGEDELHFTSGFSTGNDDRDTEANQTGEQEPAQSSSPRDICETL